MARFRDRKQAGEELARALKGKFTGSAVVYALPRGGVVPGIAVAEAIGAPLDLVIPRKIGSPDDPEFAVAALAEDGTVVRDEAEVSRIDPDLFRAEVARQAKEARRRRKAYLAGRPAVPVEGLTAIIVDDGIATGLTMRAAIADVRRKRPARIVVAVPVCSVENERVILAEADEFFCLSPEQRLGSIGEYYDDFPQVEDDEVVALMKRI